MFTLGIIICKINVKLSNISKVIFLLFPAEMPAYTPQAVSEQTKPSRVFRIRYIEQIPPSESLPAFIAAEKRFDIRLMIKSEAELSQILEFLKKDIKLVSLSLMFLLPLPADQLFYTLRNKTDLQSLSLPVINSRKESFQYLAQLANLTHLALNTANLDNDIAAVLCKLKNLKILNLGNNEGITDKIMENLLCLENLEYLDFSRNAGITKDVFMYLAKMPRLKEANLLWTSVPWGTPEGFIPGVKIITQHDI